MLAFFRIYAFHILMIHLMVAKCWLPGWHVYDAGWWLGIARLASTALVTHAGLHIVKHLLFIYLLRSPARQRPTHNKGLVKPPVESLTKAMMYNAVSVLCWSVGFGGLVFGQVVVDRWDIPRVPIPLWGFVSLLYIGLVIIHKILATLLPCLYRASR